MREDFEKRRMRARAGGLVALCLLSWGCAAASTGGGGAPPPVLLGSFEDDYGSTYTVSATEWVQEPGSRYRIVRWNPRGQYLIARNDAGNPGEGDLWTRIDWMAMPGDMAPFTWAFCYSAYDAATAEAAEAAEIAQRETPRTGCNGYPFSRMRPAAEIAFTNVTVVDASGPGPLADQTVIVRGDRIAAVGPAAATPVPAGARVVDGRGRFLIPGLWDMHVHTAVPGGREVLALYVANGVTGVRDMAGDFDQIIAWRAEITGGTLLGPRIVASGPYIEGGDVPIPHVLARTPAEAVTAVDSLVRLGVDFVKLHGQLQREVYLAAARAATARGLLVAGHVPRSVTPLEASEAGVSSQEHLLQMPTPCTADEAPGLAPRFAVQTVLGICTLDDLTPLFAQLAANGTRVVPTLVAQYEIASWPQRALPGDSYAALLPDSLERYVAGIFPMPDSIPVGAEVVGHALFDKRVALVGAMHRAGVVVLAGTDAPLRNSPPGFGLHEELSLFARAGMSPFDVLRLATVEPARYLGLFDSLGSIEVGKLADLVLLEANPLADVANLRRVVAVTANGRLLDADARSALLQPNGRGGAFPPL